MTVIASDGFRACYSEGHVKRSSVGLLLLVFGALACEGSLAASKPAVDVSFQMDRGLFSFAELDEPSENSIIDLVCEGARQKWGFVDWCIASTERPRSALWTVRLAIEPRPPAESDEETNKIWIRHYFRSSPDRSDPEPLHSIELYDYHQPKPVNSSADLAEKILWGLGQQFQAQSGWDRALKDLKTVPLIKDLRIYDRNGRKFITVPFKLCDLQLQEHATFRVKLAIDDFFNDEFHLKNIGIVNPAQNPDLGEFIVGKVSRWEVNSVVVEPNPTASPSVDGEQLLGLIREYEKSVFMEEFDIGTGCVTDSSGLSTDPGD